MSIVQPEIVDSRVLDLFAGSGSLGLDALSRGALSVDFVEHSPELRGENIRFQSFANFLVEAPPAAVKEKLRKWGVSDYQGIFCRALGINSIFASRPDREILSDEFLRNYYRYADHLFAARQEFASFTELNTRRFTFNLYASGEYAQMLEREWEQD